MNKFWNYHYFVLSGTKLNIFDIQRISINHTLKVQTKIIEFTERSYVKEVRLDRDKQGICDGKHFVMNFITAHSTEDEE